MRILPSITLLAATLLAGCVTVTAHGDPARAGFGPPPPNDTLNATVWYQRALERDLVYAEVYRSAGRMLDAALADAHWDALPRGDRDNADALGTLPAAIIVDVDETVLDNSAHQARMIRDRTEFSDGSWDAWVQQRAAPALAGAVAFLDGAADKGVTVFYVSNREVAQAEATVANLRAAGFPIRDASQFLGKGTPVEGCEGKASDKGCRRELIGRSYRVLMQFGGQLGDFLDIPANTPEGRRSALVPYAGWVGERWWVLPNPVYGSWEPAQFGNDWSQGAAERRAAKEAALEDLRP
jgi:acid phosphatase